MAGGGGRMAYDVMAMRRMLMQMVGGSMSQHKSGNFTGDGTSSVALQIGFEPDVIVISAPVDWNSSGWAGAGLVGIAKGIFTCGARHSSTGIANVGYIVYCLDATTGDYGNAETAPNGAYYGSYSNGAFTITNSAPANGNRFMSGTVYTWDAYKK